MTDDERAKAMKPIADRLAAGVRLELATLPPYLTAMWSLRPTAANREVHELLLSVLMEEMLHMTLAANVLSAIGSAADFRDPKQLPAYPLTLEFDAPDGSRHRAAHLHLQAFCPGSLRDFMQLELPSEKHGTERAAGLEAMVVPAFTIGEFYEAIERDLAAACERFGEAAVFSGPASRQIPAEFYWHGGGRPIVVRGLQDALDALNTIRMQGEGAHGVFDDERGMFDEPDEVAHYYRLQQLHLGRRYREGDRPGHPSGGPCPVDWGAVLPLRPDCRAADFAGHPALAALNDRFNAAYTMMLWQLSEGFGGNPGVFYTAIMNGMKTLGPLARELMSHPLPGDPQGRHATPSFEWNPAGAGLD